MSSPIAVKGVRRLLEELGDQVVPRPKDLERLPPGSAWDSEVDLELDGRYGFDKAGHFALAGRVVLEVPGDLPVDLPDLTVDEGADFSSLGDGTVRLRFRAHLEIRKDSSSPSKNP